MQRPPRAWPIGPRRTLAAIAGLALAGVRPAAAAAAPEPAPTSVAADPGADVSAEAATADDAAPETPLALARRLYDEGTVAYSASDYDQAIEKFTEALRIISTQDVDVGADTRALLLYNLATAHRKAYEMSRSLQHLRKAVDLYDRIAREATSAGYSADTVMQAKDARSAVERTLREEEAKAAAARRAATAPRVDPVPRRLVIAGGTLAGVGLASSALWIAGIALGLGANRDIEATTRPSQAASRTDLFDRGRQADALAISGAVVSAVLVTTGIALLAAGIARKRKRAGTEHAWRWQPLSRAGAR
ncbi:MAG: hypothetical protein U0168_09195 [Nannocystaceae bacterium]